MGYAQPKYAVRRSNWVEKNFELSNEGGRQHFEDLVVGSTVKDSQGKNVGKVSRVRFNDANDLPDSIIVALKRFLLPERRVVLSLDDVGYIDSAGVVLNLTKRDLKHCEQGLRSHDYFSDYDGESMMHKYDRYYFP